MKMDWNRKAKNSAKEFKKNENMLTYLKPDYQCPFEEGE